MVFVSSGVFENVDCTNTVKGGMLNFYDISQFTILALCIEFASISYCYDLMFSEISLKAFSIPSILSKSNESSKQVSK